MLGDYEKLKKDIMSLTTVDLNAYKEKQMKRRIDSLIVRNNISSYDEYVKVLKEKGDLFNEFMNYFTINVSEFFRNPLQWDIFDKQVIAEIKEKGTLPKIWSAACSTGDEPYTIVMILSKYFDLKKIKILATDIDKTILEKAQIGLYSEKSVKNVPKEFLNKFFTKNGDFYQISDEIKNCVEFKLGDLLKDEYPKDKDIIVCRNVLIYFTEEAKDEIYKRFNKSLKKEGVLFVGNTEQLISASEFNFEPIKTFFYRKLSI
ncbi:MAG: protein-glutamate O-methyltransferase CheR [Clostridia bacterium]|jgi:chemotaxis protein methyltransferase CheR|nr:protein-glutamate O-methyltransferase CheR [Clostridia bacterium]